MFYFFSKLLIAPFIKLIWLNRISGLENVLCKNYIIAANHESYFDFILLYLSWSKSIHFLAGEVFFKKWYWVWLMKLTKQIKVDRSSIDKSSSIKEAIYYLKRNEIVGVFPEGTRSSDGKLQKAYNGSVKLSLLANVPIIPVGIKGTYEIMSRHDKFPSFNKAEIKVGKPIYYPLEFKERVNDKNFLDELTRSLMITIGNLSQEEYSF